MIRAAAEADIPAIMRTERMPGFEWVVGRWDEALHRAEMALGSTGYLVAEADGAHQGFAILQHLDDHLGNVHLKRIAVREPNRGVGRALLWAAMREAFARPRAHRLWLTVAQHNERARHLYESVGFQQEGIMREAFVNPTGQRFSAAVMSILRPEWEAQRA
jgi:RimJ/RimL family protein N-acetyltransferase